MCARGVTARAGQGLGGLGSRALFKPALGAARTKFHPARSPRIGRDPEDKLPAAEIVLGTRLFPYRHSAASASPLVTISQTPSNRRTCAAFAALRATWDRSDANPWMGLFKRSVTDPRLRKTAPPRQRQVAGRIRLVFINRPVSRWISRALLKTPITPNVDVIDLSAPARRRRIFDSVATFPA